MKYTGNSSVINRNKSRPARGAWVEIKPILDNQSSVPVAPRKGRVG